MGQLMFLIVAYFLRGFLWAGMARAQATPLGKSAPTTLPPTKRDGFPSRAVFIDAATEKQFGPFPYDRAFYARGIRELDKLGARAVVVKFFLDKAKSAEGDADLAKAITESKARIILEASLSHGEEKPNPLPS